jgi:hypothetical protein
METVVPLLMLIRGARLKTCMFRGATTSLLQRVIATILIV